ncbi:MAG: hypothetical protein D3919_12860 [Candidatus Electrothrix sp. AW5]|nr:hypothetical protein [Candidatus Electrothrix gigas]
MFNWLIVIILLLFQLIVSNSVAYSMKIGKINTISNSKVYLVKNGKRKILKETEDIYLNDVISTRGKGIVEIMMSNGATWNLSNRSTIFFSEYEKKSNEVEECEKINLYKIFEGQYKYHEDSEKRECTFIYIAEKAIKLIGTKVKITVQDGYASIDVIDGSVEIQIDENVSIILDKNDPPFHINDLTNLSWTGGDMRKITDPDGVITHILEGDVKINLSPVAPPRPKAEILGQ